MRKVEEGDEEEVVRDSELNSQETLGCSICQEDHLIEECPIIVNTVHIQDSQTLPKAIATIPGPIVYQEFDDGSFNLIARDSISKGTQFGPVDAPCADEINHAVSPGFLELKLFREKSFHCYLDTTDRLLCNWMTLVKYDQNEHNLVCYQLNEDIYFTAIKDIQVGEELCVGYSRGYGFLMGVPDTSENENSEVVPSLAQAETTVEISELQDEYSFQLPLVENEDGSQRIFTTTSDYRPPNLGSFASEMTISADDVENTISPFDQVPYAYDEDYPGSGRVENTNYFEDDTPWVCKFCSLQYPTIAEFARHLVEHYKKLACASKEKMRGDDNPFTITSSRIESSDEDTENPEVPARSYKRKEYLVIPRFPYFCDICAKQKVFHLAEYMVRHLIKHAADQTCTNCGQTFSTEDGQRNHECLIDLPTLRFKPTIQPLCKLCPQLTFKIFRKLRQHAKVKHIFELHKCLSCKKVFSSFDVYESHSCEFQLQQTLGTNQPKFSSSFQCEFCRITFHEKTEINLHICKAHCSPLKCTTCDKALTQSTIGVHSVICEAVDKYAKGITLLLHCPICISRGFISITEFRKHVQIHTNPYICAKCDLRMHSRSELVDHECVPFYCDDMSCTKNIEKFLMSGHLLAHLYEEHDKTEVEKYYCYECCLYFATKAALTQHDRCKVRDSANDTTVTTITGNAKTDRSIEKKQSIEENIEEQTHFDNALVSKNKSKRQRDYVCEKCGARYSSWNSMKTHRYTHLPKNHVCKICGKKFHRRDLLKIHEYIHGEANFACDKCGKKFKCRKTLAIHRKIHSGIRRFSCEECGMSFTQKVNLQAHLAIHTPLEKRGFQCRICSKYFSNEAYLKFHIESKHNDENLSETESIRRRQKLHCSTCNKLFFKAYSAKQHFLNVHSNQCPKYSCEFCDLVVTHSQSLRRHMKRLHPEMESVWSGQGYMKTRYIAKTEKQPESNSDLIVTKLANTQTDCETICTLNESEEIIVITVQPEHEEDGDLVINAPEESHIEDETAEATMQIEFPEEPQLEEFVLPPNGKPHILILETDEQGRGTFKLAEVASSIEDQQIYFSTDDR